MSALATLELTALSRAGPTATSTTVSTSTAALGDERSRQHRHPPRVIPDREPAQALRTVCGCIAQLINRTRFAV